MATPAQIEANRANAQKSTGPVSDLGKAITSQNRATHLLSQYATFVVLSHEDPDLFLELTGTLMTQFGVTPDQPDEHAIVTRMAQHEWMRRRALEYQDWIFNDDRIDQRIDRMKLFMRYESQHERAYNSCFNQLLKLRAEKRSAKIGFERETQLCQQVEERKQRHETVQKARQVDIECKIVRTLRTSASNPEALDAARKVQTRFQAA